jgi:hypothetical protein
MLLAVIAKFEAEAALAKVTAEVALKSLQAAMSITPTSCKVQSAEPDAEMLGPLVTRLSEVFLAASDVTIFVEATKDSQALKLTGLGGGGIGGIPNMSLKLNVHEG